MAPKLNLPPSTRLPWPWLRRNPVALTALMSTLYLLVVVIITANGSPPSPRIQFTPSSSLTGLSGSLSFDSPALCSSSYLGADSSPSASLSSLCDLNCLVPLAKYDVGLASRSFTGYALAFMRFSRNLTFERA
jgi:hypothetical protein